MFFFVHIIFQVFPFSLTLTAVFIFFFLSFFLLLLLIFVVVKIHGHEWQQVLSYNLCTMQYACVIKIYNDSKENEERMTTTTAAATTRNVKHNAWRWWCSRRRIPLVSKLVAQCNHSPCTLVFLVSLLFLLDSLWMSHNWFSFEEHIAHLTFLPGNMFFFFTCIVKWFASIALTQHTLHHSERNNNEQMN